MDLGERLRQKWVKCLLLRYISKCLTPGGVTCDMNLPLVTMASDRLLHCQVMVFSFSILCSWKQIAKSSPHLMGADLDFTSSEENQNYFEFFCEEDLSLISHLFIFSQSFTNTSVDRVYVLHLEL